MLTGRLATLFYVGTSLNKQCDPQDVGILLTDGQHIMSHGRIIICTVATT